MSVRITAAGAVAVALLAFHTAPVSACDERFIKKCEKAAAAAAAAADAQDVAPAAKRRSVKRVQVVATRGARHSRLEKRSRAPRFIKREAGMTLASANARPVTLPESAAWRRFRGFIDPRPIAQNAFEVWRKPHVIAANLELPDAASVTDAAPASAAAEAPPPAPAAVTGTKQDRAVPASGTQLASAESRPVVLPELPRHGAAVAASLVPMPTAQPILTEAPVAPTEPQPSRFGFHQLVIALCGALGAASALRFIVGV